MSVKITTKLPKDEHNGLSALEAVYEENPLSEVWVVCKLALARRTADFDRKDDPTVLAVRFASIEPMVAGSKDETTIRNCAKRGFKARTGIDTLPGMDDAEASLVSDKATCRSCGAPIIWVFNKSGRRMPVDYDPVAGGNLVLIEAGPIYEVEHVEPSGDVRYRSHFATCKQADEWRKTK